MRFNLLNFVLPDSKFLSEFNPQDLRIKNDSLNFKNTENIMAKYLRKLAISFYTCISVFGFFSVSAQAANWGQVSHEVHENSEEVNLCLDDAVGEHARNSSLSNTRLIDNFDTLAELLMEPYSEQESEQFFQRSLARTYGIDNPDDALYLLDNAYGCLDKLLTNFLDEVEVEYIIDGPSLPDGTVLVGGFTVDINLLAEGIRQISKRNLNDFFMSEDFSYVRQLRSFSFEISSNHLDHIKILYVSSVLKEIISQYESNPYRQTDESIISLKTKLNFLSFASKYYLSSIDLSSSLNLEIENFRKKLSVNDGVAFLVFEEYLNHGELNTYSSTYTFGGNFEVETIRSGNTVQTLYKNIPLAVQIRSISLSSPRPGEIFDYPD
jgi:hypothetical protein